MDDAGENAVDRICGYLSPDLKQAVFDLLLSACPDEEYLAREIGCSVSLLQKWKEGRKQLPGGGYMSKILSLALAYHPDTKVLLEESLVKTVQRLFRRLDVCGKEKAWSKENISLFMDELDEESRKIFWYFRCHGHGLLSELTELVGASADMEVLYRLKEVINPAALKIFGRPLLEFNESRIDRNTGKKVLFNWWLSDFAEDGQSPEGDPGKPLMDLFDEEDEFVIIFEAPSSIPVSDRVKIERQHGILSIRLNKSG